MEIVLTLSPLAVDVDIWTYAIAFDKCFLMLSSDYHLLHVSVHALMVLIDSCTWNCSGFGQINSFSFDAIDFER